MDGVIPIQYTSAHSSFIGGGGAIKKTHRQGLNLPTFPPKASWTVSDAREEKAIIFTRDSTPVNHPSINSAQRVTCLDSASRRTEKQTMKVIMATTVIMIMIRVE